MSTATVILIAIGAASPPSPPRSASPNASTRRQRDPPPGEHTARPRADRTAPAPDLDALTPGPVGTGWLEHLPDDDPADITGVQPHATSLPRHAVRSSTSTSCSTSMRGR